jgi:hypothetical protein
MSNFVAFLYGKDQNSDEFTNVFHGNEIFELSRM